MCQPTVFVFTATFTKSLEFLMLSFGLLCYFLINTKLYVFLSFNYLELSLCIVRDGKKYYKVSTLKWLEIYVKRKQTQKMADDNLHGLYFSVKRTEYQSLLALEGNAA